MKNTIPPEEKYICEECGTEVPTVEEFCPNCGAPMEHYIDAHIDAKDDEEEDDLSPEALAKGLDQDDSQPVSLEKLREDEDDDEDYNAIAQNNSE